MIGAPLPVSADLGPADTGPVEVTITIGAPIDAPPTDLAWNKRGAGRWRWWIARWNPGHYRYGDYLDIPGDRHARNATGPVAFVAGLAPGGRYVFGCGAARYELRVPYELRPGAELRIEPVTLGDAIVTWGDGADDPTDEVYRAPELGAEVPF